MTMVEEEAWTSSDGFWAGPRVKASDEYDTRSAVEGCRTTKKERS